MMTPEEHIERAEAILVEWGSCSPHDAVAAQRAAVHVAIADHKKKFPSDSGRPMQKFPMGQIAVEGARPYPGLPADHPMNRGRPIADNPQA